MPDLLAIQTSHEAKVLAAFRESIQAVRDQATIAEIVRLLEAGDVDGVITLLDLDQSTFEPLEEAIRQAYREGGLVGAEQIGSIPIDAGTVAAKFSMQSQAAVQWITNMSARLVTEIVDDQRQMIRERLTEAVSSGVNPRTAALDLVGRIDQRTKKRAGGFIGLTSGQAKWAANARTELESLDSSYFQRKLRDKRYDSTIRKAINEGKPLNQTQIARIVNSMQHKILKYRGDVISRTESLNALRAGQYEAIRQAAEKGEVSLQEVMKEWDATMDKRTRLDHMEMEATYSGDGAIPFNQVFIAPDGSRLRFPGDVELGASAKEVIQCRCRCVYKIDFIGRQARVEGFR